MYKGGVGKVDGGYLLALRGFADDLHVLPVAEIGDIAGRANGLKHRQVVFGDGLYARRPDFAQHGNVAVHQLDVHGGMFDIHVHHLLQPFAHFGDGKPGHVNFAQLRVGDLALLVDGIGEQFQIVCAPTGRLSTEKVQKRRIERFVADHLDVEVVVGPDAVGIGKGGMRIDLACRQVVQIGELIERGGARRQQESRGNSKKQHPANPPEQSLKVHNFQIKC